MVNMVEVHSLILNALLGLCNEFMSVLPGILVAILMATLGWIVGRLVGDATKEILIKIGIDKRIKEEGLSGALWGEEISSILGALIKWYIIIVFLGEAANQIKLQSLAVFISQLTLYLPRLFSAFIIIIIGLLIGEYLKKSLRELELPHKELLGDAAKFLVFYFALVIGLQTAEFDITILIDAFRIGFAALAATLAIIIGISFGLAFRKDAESLLKEFKSQMKPKKKAKKKR